MLSTEKVCFVVSPIGQQGTEIRQKADDFLEFIVKGCEAISKYDYRVVRGDEINEPGRITVQVIRYIDSAELVIADVTGGNENVYYELALRHALGKPLITCAEKGTLLPFDTRDNRTIFYSMHSRDARRARSELAKQIEAVNSNGFKPDNPILDALKVIKLAESTDTNEQTLALMLQKLDDVSGRMSVVEQGLSNVASSIYALDSNSYATSGIAGYAKTLGMTGPTGPNFSSMRPAYPSSMISSRSVPDENELVDPKPTRQSKKG